ncbi:MAG: helix-turn-helix domain-containing protein [Pseudomonadales bacterium]|nr:helix-turn-helix domain-containing protein [Pseudomonadales bacterium]
MDMKVNSKLIRIEREKRAWSQQHLANVSGLGIRTIQRIETSGTASNESVKALASVFEMEISQLQASNPKLSIFDFFTSTRIRIATILLALVGLIALATIRPSLAESILLDYTISIDDQDAVENIPPAVRMGNELLPEGSTATIIIEDFRLEVTPEIQADGEQVLLAVKVFKIEEGEFSLRGQPKVMTLNSELATIRSNSNSGDQLSVYLTPTIQ